MSAERGDGLFCLYGLFAELSDGPLQDALNVANELKFIAKLGFDLLAHALDFQGERLKHGLHFGGKGGRFDTKECLHVGERCQRAR